ncbi:unnamed protein product [Amoebophrya sp. A120]|nr:unnamed protein product [Amoebophrya sp. A120]|eukprot:GSA120T00005089001.1
MMRGSPGAGGAAPAAYSASSSSAAATNTMRYRGQADVSPALKNLQQRYDQEEKRMEMICRLVVVTGLVGLVLYLFSPQTNLHRDDDLFDTSNPTPQMYAHLQDSVRFQPQTGWLPVSPVVFFTCLAVLIAGYNFVKAPPAEQSGRLPGQGVPSFQNAGALVPVQQNNAPVVDLRPGEANGRSLWGSSNVGKPNALTAHHQHMQGTAGGSGSSSSSAPPPVPNGFAGGLSLGSFFGAAKFDDQGVRTEFPAVPWLVGQLENMVQQSIIPPLLQQLRESDELWQQGLRRVGKTLSFEEPSSRTGDRQNGNILSVFDRNLPAEFASDQNAVQLWKKRQEMEVYLCHPSFPLVARNYVHSRLMQWASDNLTSASGLRSLQSNGFKRNYHAEQADPATGITDSHILENLLVKTLESHLGHQFAAKYMASTSANGSDAHTTAASRKNLSFLPSATSAASSLAATAYNHLAGNAAASNGVLLRSFRLPNGGISYEVLGSRVFRLQNLLDAFALFFWLKRTDVDWQQFPLGILTVVRDAESMFAATGTNGPGAPAMSNRALDQEERERQRRQELMQGTTANVGTLQQQQQLPGNNMQQQFQQQPLAGTINTMGMMGSTTMMGNPSSGGAFMQPSAQFQQYSALSNQPGMTAMGGGQPMFAGNNSSNLFAAGGTNAGLSGMSGFGNTTFGGGGSIFADNSFFGQGAYSRGR